MSVLATDDFNRANGVAGADWTEPAGSAAELEIVGNEIAAPAGAFDYVLWNNTTSWPDDQYAQARLGTERNSGTDIGPGVVVRQHASANTLYRLVVNHISGGDNGWISKIVAGSYSTITSWEHTWTDDDTWRLQVTGTTLEAWCNGVLIATTTDADIATGNAGILLSGDNWGASYYIDDFAGGDSDGTGGSPGVHEVDGRGFFTIDGPLWIKTEWTADPSVISYGAAEPKNWYHVGMISWGTANGVMRAYPVTREVDLVELPAGMTVLHYEFASFITATITELDTP